MTGFEFGGRGQKAPPSRPGAPKDDRDSASRAARIDDWAGFAADAIAHAEDPALEPTGRFLHRAESARVWAWPRAGLTRCKALAVLGHLYAQSRAEERAVLAGPMAELAGAVLEVSRRDLFDGARSEGEAVSTRGEREPRKDIYG